MSEPPQKRFRYATYNEKLSNISVDVGRRKGHSWEKEEFGEDEQTKTPLTVELARLELHDLTLPYQELSRTLQPLTRTLPMTLLNLDSIFETFSAFFLGLKEGVDNANSGLDSALFLLQALFETVLSEATSHVPSVVQNLGRVGALRALEPKLIERTYSTLSLVLRSISPSLLKPENAPKLRATWDAVRPYLLRSNKPYVRKCIADAWAGVLRKARGDALARLMALLLEQTEGMEAVWTNAIKGTSGHLHSRAVPIFTGLVDHVVADPTDEGVAMLRHIATALVHHCKAGETAPLVEVVLERIAPKKSDKASSSKQPAVDLGTAALDILSAFLFTRKGKRFPPALLKPTMLKLHSLVPQLKVQAANAEASRWRQAVVTAVVGALAAGHLAEWLSPGVALIDALWAALSTPEAFAFVNMCIGVKWPGVEQFLLAHVARTALTGLAEDPLPTLLLLNNLARAGFLAGGLANVQGGRWRQALTVALGKLLTTLDASDLAVDDRRVLGQVLALIPHLAGEGRHFADQLISILTRVVDATETDKETLENYTDAGVWNDSHVVAGILRSAYQLVLRGTSGVQDQFKACFVDNDLGNALLRKWHWNREVLEQAAVFIEHWPEELSLDTSAIDLLLPNLLSADSALRLASLKILAVSARNTPEASAIWALCIQVEQSEMSLKNVRERSTNIARLGRHLAALPADTEAPITPAIAYLVAQLKVNFRPVWSETVNAIKDLSGVHGETVWGTLWGQLEKTIVTTKTLMPDLSVENPEWTTQRVRDTDEEIDDDEEQEFHCGALTKGRSVAASAWQQNTDVARVDVKEIPLQISADRLEVLSYEGQLFAVLAATPSIAEKHTRVLVPVVLAIAGAESEATVELSHLSTRALQTRTITVLELFAKFVNPKAAYRSADLHALYLVLLSKGDAKVQGVALKCLLTYKSPSLVPYGDRLRGLLEDSKFRDELAHFELGLDSVVIEPMHRAELVPTVIRLLYGIMMSRRARSSTAQGQVARKQAVLTSLSGCSSDELGTLVNLMLEPFGGFDATPAELAETSMVAAGRQQLGYLSFLHDVLRYLAPQTVEHWPRLVGATIALIHQAQLAIDNEKDKEGEAGADDEEAEDDDEAEVDAADKGAAPLRSIRSIGLKRLVQFLRSSAITEFDLSPYLQPIYGLVISPRLARLEIENTQAPSGTLDLITALASSPETATSLVTYDDRTLPKTLACLTAVKVKPAVIGRVFDVLDSLLVEDTPEITQTVLLPNMRVLLDNIIGLVQTLRSTNANEDIMRRLLGILSRLSAVVTDGQQAQQLAALLGPMLRQPGRQVSEKAKVNILITLQRLYAISPDFADPSSKFFSHSYDLISNLFQTLYLPSSRRALVGALREFGSADTSLADSVALVADLNSYKIKRLDEPDYDTRLDAFARITDAPDERLPQTARAWLPILRTALHFMQEPDELSIRTNAGSLLQRFVSLVGDADEGPLVDQLQTVVLTGLRRVLLSKVELVRNEALRVLAHAVKTSSLPVLVEMRPLLGADADEETNIFINICHIQVHRRARAVRRLRELVAEGGIRETTITNFFIPVLQHIVSGTAEVTDHHLVNEAITSIGALAGSLSWSRYNALINRFLRLGAAQTKQQRYYIRCVSAIIDNFHFDLKSNARVVAVDAEEGEDEAGADEDSEETLQDPAAQPTAHIVDVVLTRLLPALSKFVAQKSDTDDSVRIPVALGFVKVAYALPDETSADEIVRIITTVSQILRSKDQDTRDIARDTIGKIAVFLGPEWLVRVIRELRTALQRGPQKHVLAVTTHSILVHATSEAGNRFVDLDAAVEDAVEISAEVIWGESGKDVATEGFKTKMREVRGATSRGNDTFQLVSRLVSPAKLGAVLAPVREIMTVSQAVKTMQQVDEVLRRIALGLNANAMLGPEDILNLCYSLINGNSRYLQAKKKAPKAAKDRTDRFTVQMKRERDEDVDVYAQNAYKFVSFGLELFVTAFRRGKFDFDDVNILARLGPLVNAIGNTLYSPTAAILGLGLKATAAIAKCPVPQVDAALPAFVTNIFKIIKHAGGTAESEIAQTALKTLAVLIRDCKATQVSEAQLRYLVEVIAPDIEEHDRQAAIFTVLRAVVARRLVVPEIYDLMDRVSGIMVTSQSTHVQELCRGVLMQFLLDYPQGTGRLKAQMTFLARNLDYVFESGRVSVMEVLSAIFSKFSQDLVAEYADLFFVALVAVVANDDSEKCRNMAGALLQQLYAALHPEHQARTLGVLEGWVEARDDNPALASAALAVYGLLCEAAAAAGGDSDSLVLEGLPKLVVPVIHSSAMALARAEASDDTDTVALDYALPHQALSVTAKALSAFPPASVAALTDALPWADVVAHLLFPHEWVRFGAARVLAVLFATRPAGTDGKHTKRKDAANGAAVAKVDGKDAIALLGPDLCLDVARKSCILLGGSRTADGERVVVDAKLADQLVKLLWNVAKDWAAAERQAGIAADADGPDDDEVDDDADDEEAAIAAASARPLAWLMSRASFLARRLIVTRAPSNDVLPGQVLPWTGPVSAILRLFAGITTSLSAAQARGFLIHTLAPIHRILDEGGDLASEKTDAAGLDDLRTLATEVREFVQAKVGATAFSRAWETLRQRTGEIRSERREKRSRLAVADPRAWAKRQEKRGERKKESKKRKKQTFMDAKRARVRR